MDFRYLFEKTRSECLKLTCNPHWVADEFCHYTNLQGLFGIVENNELWLSDYRFLNDGNEYNYGKSLAISVITEVMNSETDVEFRLFLNNALDYINEPKDNYIFIGSMSKSYDNLNMWRSYSGNHDGVCIKFNGDFESWNIGNSHPTHIRQQEMVYERVNQINLIENIIKIYKNSFEEYKSFAFPFLRDFFYSIESLFIIFKDAQFSSENELRITLANFGQIYEVKKLKHRLAKNMLIPFVTTKYISKDINPSVQLLPIKEITVSPTSKTHTIESVKVFMSNMGYTDVNVVKSKIIDYRD